MLIFVFILVAAAMFLLFWSGQNRKSAGLPGGRVIYTDTRSWGPVEKPLFDPVLGLTGKPDYLLSQGGKVIPVEVKSSRVREAPYDEHIFQLAAYCLLVQRVYGQRPPYGILHYPNRTYAIDWTPDLEAALLDLLAEMRRQDRRASVNRSHESPARCRGCGYRTQCDQRLV
jgi:CRISPR-associated exonuclease Cas4